MKNIVIPTINGMKSEGMEYEGILYAGIMLTNNGPKVIEFNCRFGDPETQVILPRLKTDLVDIVKKSVEKNLNNFEIELVSQKAITVVIASKGYPVSFNKELVLPSLDKVNKLDMVTIYHSGTSLNKDNDLISNGGRVFSITALGKDLKECKEQAYHAVETINWDQGFYRKDIGKL
jgi:phosphoribosylamine--glycine ligase